MKNNNIIQEEINRAKQLWGYDTSKTIFEQSTGNTGTSNTCYAITSLTPCSGGTYGGYDGYCFSVNGVPGTQGHLGTVVQGPYGMIGTIQNTAPIPTTSGTLQLTQTTCPNTNTGTTGGPYPNGTPCYACINNQIESVLFPSNALGQPYPSCAPTAYGYQGQSNALPGGAASYAYPSIWSEVQPTNCGTGSGGGTSTTYYPCYGCENGQVVASGTSPINPAQTPLASWVNPGGGGGTLFPAPTGSNNFCATIGSIPFYYAPNIPSLPAPLQNCGGNTGSCNKDCSQLVPSNFAGKIANKPCKWLNNRENAFTNKLTTLTQGSCQHKRVQCKLQMVTDLKNQLGC